MPFTNSFPFGVGLGQHGGKVVVLVLVVVDVLEVVDVVVDEDVVMVVDELVVDVNVEVTVDVVVLTVLVMVVSVDVSVMVVVVVVVAPKNGIGRDQSWTLGAGSSLLSMSLLEEMTRMRPMKTAMGAISSQWRCRVHRGELRLLGSETRSSWRLPRPGSTLAESGARDSGSASMSRYSSGPPGRR